MHQHTKRQALMKTNVTGEGPKANVSTFLWKNWEQSTSIVTHHGHANILSINKITEPQRNEYVAWVFEPNNANASVPSQMHTHWLCLLLLQVISVTSTLTSSFHSCIHS
jgi:hypothetical protein